MQSSAASWLLHDKADLLRPGPRQVYATSAATTASLVELYPHSVILLRLAANPSLSLGPCAPQLLGMRGIVPLVLNSPGRLAQLKVLHAARPGPSNPAGGAEPTLGGRGRASGGKIIEWKSSSTRLGAVEALVVTP